MKIDLEKYANPTYSGNSNRWRKMYFNFTLYDTDLHKFIPGPIINAVTETKAKITLDAFRFYADILEKIKCGDIPLHERFGACAEECRYNRRNWNIELSDGREVGGFNLALVTVSPKTNTIRLAGYRARYDESKSTWVIHWTFNGRDMYHVADVPDTDDINDILDPMIEDVKNS